MTYRQTQTNYRNPPAHARRGLTSIYIHPVFIRLAIGLIMASLRSAILCLFVIFTVLQLSACLLEKMKGIGRHWGDQVVHQEHIPLKDALKVFPSVRPQVLKVAIVEKKFLL